jgi:hypothetical protein
LRSAIVAGGEDERATPAGAPGGRTLVDQVSIDIAPDRFDEERRFSADLTGWTPRPRAEPEYAVATRADGQPFRLLLQRPGAADAGFPATCHLDLACDDIDTSVDEHTEIGARVVARFRRWSVMADPAGVEYCLSGRYPDARVCPIEARRRAPSRRQSMSKLTPWASGSSVL